MSLVLGYANKDNAIIMSDGRAMGKVFSSENYNKTRKINENIILGFVGYKEPCEHFLNCVYMDMGKRTESCYMDEFLEEIEYEMSLDKTKKELESAFMIIGRTEIGEMYSVIVGNSTDYKIEKNLVCTPRALLIGGVSDKNMINALYDKNITNMNMSIEECMRKTIAEASEVDGSINDNFFTRII